MTLCVHLLSLLVMLIEELSKWTAVADEDLRQGRQETSFGHPIKTDGETYSCQRSDCRADENRGAKGVDSPWMSGFCLGENTLAFPAFVKGLLLPPPPSSNGAMSLIASENTSHTHFLPSSGNMFRVATVALSFTQIFAVN